MTASRYVYIVLVGEAHEGKRIISVHETQHTANVACFMYPDTFDERDTDKDGNAWWRRGCDIGEVQTHCVRR